MDANQLSEDYVFKLSVLATAGLAVMWLAFWIAIIVRRDQRIAFTEKRRKATPFKAGDIRRICEAKPIFAPIRLVLAV